MENNLEKVIQGFLLHLEVYNIKVNHLVLNVSKEEFENFISYIPIKDKFIEYVDYRSNIPTSVKVRLYNDVKE